MSMRIGELARRAGVGVATLRAWERRFGLLEPARTRGRQRLYTDDDLERVRSVQRLVADGLTVGAAARRVSVAGAGGHERDPEALLLQQVIHAADDGIWVSRHSATRFVNRRMAELLRCSMDEIMSRPVEDFIEPDSLPLFREWGEQVLHARRLRGRLSLRRPDGSTLQAEVSVSPIFDQAGSYQHSVTLVRDATGRDEAERQTRFRAALLDGVGQPVAAATPDGTLVYVNPAAERMFGWRAAEIIGKNGLEILPAPASADEARSIHARLLSGRPYTGDFRLARRDGTEFVARMSSSPVRGEGDRLIGLIAVYTDLTESIDLREEMRTCEVELESAALLGAHALRTRVGVPADADAAITEALDAIRRVVGADRATLLEVIPGETELQPRCGSPPDAYPGTVPRGGRSLAGYTAVARRTVVVEDALAERRFDRGAGDRQNAAVAAPVHGPTGVRAVLVAEWAEPQHSFPPTTVHFIENMANVIGASLR